MRFLVVDDQPLMTGLICRTLESDGHACHAAGSITDAAQVVAGKQIDGMVLDLHLPDGNGLKWLEGVHRSRPSLTRNTVVATGADLSLDDRRRLADVGAVLLQKPFSLETLRSVFLDLIESHRSRPRRAQDRRFAPSPHLDREPGE